MPSEDPLYIQPGDLRHQIQIQAASSADRDAAGQSVDNWDLVCGAYAKIESTNSRTFRMSFSNNVLASQSTDAITMRWPGPAIDIKTGMRVQFGDNIFNIDAVDNVQRRNRKIVLACTQVSSDSN
jgi:SPP1 family predicted phage head-tail adaptor